MNTQAALTGIDLNVPEPAPVLSPLRVGKKTPLPLHVANHAMEEEGAHRHAELFYLQKQIHSQTPMVIVLATGEHVEGCIEWYDRKTLKVRGREKVLVYKSAIKYMYKVGENGIG